MTGNRATAGATLEAIMSKQAADDQLNDNELDSVAGGDSASPQLDSASPNLFSACCNGKHFDKATVTVRRAS
jgi:type VI protein secretion system component Hcp